MSFLQELISKRDRLRPVETVTTSLSGWKYIEEKNSSGDAVERRIIERCPGFVVDTKLDLQVAEILDYLYLGSQDPAQEVHLLLKQGITHVLSIGIDLPLPSRSTLTFHRVPLLDEPEENLKEALSSSIEFISRVRGENDQNKIFVHCNAGYSRAPAIVVGYLMKTVGLSLEDALKMVNDKRPVKPNPGFLKQLKEFEKEINVNFT